jgi:hypothetical protein
MRALRIGGDEPEMAELELATVTKIDAEARAQLAYST